MALLELFVAATIPVLRLLLVTALGCYLALDGVNVLGEDTRKHLNNVVFYVFSPAFVGSNLAKTITYESMAKLWFMPFNTLLTYIFGSMLGWMVIQFTRPPSHLRGLVFGCCAAGNMGNLLLIIIPAVCNEKGSPFGSPHICYQSGMGYVSLSMALAVIYFWSYVYNIVQIFSTRSIKDSTTNGYSNTKQYRETSMAQRGSSTEPLLPSKELIREQDLEDEYLLPCTRPRGKVELKVSSRLKQQLSLLVGKINLRSIIAPSTVGAIVGFVIGLIPQIRKLMIIDGAPFRVIQDSASLLGDGATPAITLILGGNLHKGLKGSGIHKSIVFSIVFARYIVLPLIGVTIIRVALHLGFVDSDALYQFVLLIQFAVPPAMNISTMIQLFGTGESECSVIMLWTYALSSVSLTLWSTFFMWLVS